MHSHQFKDKRTRVFHTSVIAVIIVALAVIAFKRYEARSQEPDERQTFAQCLTEKGAKFYGTYWCPHCTAQKKLFGKEAMKNVSYVECAIAGNPQGQTQPCKDAKINSYPTWIFADGTRVQGVQSFDDLAKKTGCVWGTESGE